MGYSRVPADCPRQRYVEDWEYAAFKEFAGPFIAAYMDFKLITGLRKGEILRLRFDHIRDDGVYVAHPTKRGKVRVIAWSDALRAAVGQVRALKRPVTSIYLFCTRRGQPYTVDGFSSIWQRKMVKALAQGVLRERFTDHDIRRKTGSDMDTVEQAMRLLGHSGSGVTQRHYRARPGVVKPLK